MNFFATDHYEARNLKSPHTLDRKLSSGSAQTSSRQRLGVEILATDVLCGRGKTSFNHVGNRRFRDLIAASTEKYNNARSRLEKSMVVHSIVEQVKKVQGRFLKQDRYSGRWYELDERQAKEKVGHAIRDASSSIDPKKKEKTSKKRSSANESTLSGTFGEEKVRSNSFCFMQDDSSRSSSSSSSRKSQMEWDDDDISSIEPIRHDSDEAKNSLAALHDDEFFLRRICAVLGQESLSREQQQDSDKFTPLPLSIF